MAAARAWGFARTGRLDPAQAVSIDADVAADFAQMGCAVEVDAEAEQEDVIEIMPANHASFAAWLECQTQWRVSGTPAGLWWQGLDYVAIRIVLDDLSSPASVFADLRRMEIEVLPILNERDD